MVHRSTILPVALLLALALFFGPSAFVGGRSYATSSNLRTATAQRALPLGVEMDGLALADSSVATGLAVSDWGMAANIVSVFVPVTFLIVLYLQSERTKLEQGIEP